MRPISEKEKLRQRADKLLGSRKANAKRKKARIQARFSNLAHKRRLTELYDEYRQSPAQFTMSFEQFKRQYRGKHA
jgi:hypothetical protein